MPLLALSGTRPRDLGPRDGRLKDCPASPNCVCSDAADAGHRIEALALAAPGPEAFEGARRAVAELPRTVIVEEAPGYLHAECSSALLGFVDDLELHLREEAIAVRSASRLGHSDLGVNRKRVEALRRALRDAGVVR